MCVCAGYSQLLFDFLLQNFIAKKIILSWRRESQNALKGTIVQNPLLHGVRT